MDNLRNRASKALLWDLVGNYGGQISAFVISIFLARLLDPEEFGLIAMAMVFIGILEVFKDFGFSSALIQNEKNTSITYSSVFYFNLLVGTVLTVVIYFIAPIIADFFESDSITILVRWLSLTLFINSFNLVQSTILKKELNFKVLTYRNLIAQLSAGTIAIFLAFYGYGIYALVFQKIVASIVAGILLWKSAKWLPKLEFSFAELKGLSGFSLYVFAAGSVNRIIEQLDSLIIGKLFSPVTLGYFSRSNGLNKLIIQNSSGSITNIFFPTLTQVKKDPERFERIFLKVISIVSAIAVYLTSVFYLVGEELIIGLFGSKWKLSVPIFQILIIKGFTFPISAMVINAFLAKGKSKENFHFGNIRKVMQLIPFVFAYFSGFYAFLYAHVGVAILIWLMNNFFAFYSLDISFRNQMFAVLPNLLVAFLISLGIIYFMPEEFSYIWALVKMIVFSLLFLAFLKLSGAPILEEGNIFLSKIKGWRTR